jgi:isochorismate synthase
LARVEPGADAESVEAELVGRLAQARACSATQSEAQRDCDRLAFDALEVADYPAGPEYRVRSDRAHAVFLAQVDRALEDIAAGGLEKVVLARSLQVDHDGEVDIPGVLGRLRELYPSCTLIAMRRGEDTFLAATPETLVRVAGDRVETAALAGSAPRGRTPEEDAALASSLQSSAKEQAEHAHVVDALSRVLAPRCAELEIDDTPGLRQLFGIQHLETSVSGRLLESEAGQDVVLGLVAALHPTPAVGGVPPARASDWLRRFEGLDRGWYASPIGWLDAAGGGDFCVALRSALIRSGSSESGREATSRAWLFAGAGIVAGSVPAQELAETRIKLRALLAPLTEI